MKPLNYILAFFSLFVGVVLLLAEPTKEQGFWLVMLVTKPLALVFFVIFWVFIKDYCKDVEE